MIKKLLGVIAALAVVAAVVVTVLHRDKYRSMVSLDELPSGLVPASILRSAAAAADASGSGTAAPASSASAASEGSEASEADDSDAGADGLE